MITNSLPAPQTLTSYKLHLHCCTTLHLQYSAYKRKYYAGVMHTTLLCETTLLFLFETLKKNCSKQIKPKIQRYFCSKSCQRSYQQCEGDKQKESLESEVRGLALSPLQLDKTKFTLTKTSCSSQCPMNLCTEIPCFPENRTYPENKPQADFYP